MVGDRHHEKPADRESESGPLPLSRRGFLGAAGGLFAGGALAGVGAVRGPSSPGEVGLTSPSVSRASAETVPFYGPHQGGITTPTQPHGFFAVFDLQTVRRGDLVTLLQRWTQIAAALCAGRPAGHLADDPQAVEPDSGAALGLGPSRLTVNVGFGSSLFGVGGPDRFGLRHRWPMALVDVPPLPGDDVQPHCTGGDLTVHACSYDPQVAFHAVRQLTRAARAVATVRWAQPGHNESAATRGTPRNLTGFKDGTVNPTTETELDEFVWAGDQDQEWMRGGTYLVARRIRIQLETWDAQPLGVQQRVIGRYKRSGAPLGRAHEHDALDLAATDAAGRPLIPADAHVRLASPQENWGQKLLRRSYSYDGGSGQLPGATKNGGLDAGLFFMAYQQNPRLAAIPMLAKLSRGDALRRFTVHTASAVAALPPGPPAPGHWIGERLFA